MAPALGTGIGLPFGGGPLGPAWAAGADMWEDFVANSGSLPTPTDTHAATIYAPNAAGVWSPYAANVLTRTDLGLQTVPTRIQLLTQPNNISDAAWVKNGCTETAGQPDSLGSTSAYLITEANNGALLRLLANITVVSASTYAVSAELKRSNCDWAKILIGDTTGFANAIRVWVNLATGVVGTNSVSGTGYGYVSSSIVAETNGIYRLTVIVTAPTIVMNVGFCSAASDGSNNRADIGGGGGVGSAYIIGNSDVTLGAFAVPPIRTGSATVNGNQQVISGLGTQLAVGVAGIIQWQQIAPAVSGYPARVIEFNDGTGANFAALRDSAGGLLQTNITAATVDQGSVSGAAGTFAAGLITVAFSFGTNFNKFRIVGGADTTADTSVTWPALTQLAIGGRGFDTSRNNYQFAKKLALDFLTPSDNPATKFTEWYDKAVLAAAA